MHKLKKLIFMFVIFAVLSGCASLDTKPTATFPCQTACDFTLQDQNNKEVKLSEVLKGYRGAVLAFYPQDNTRN